MSEPANSGKPYAPVAQKWRDLAERRRMHFAELQSSGRWKLYYTEEQFLERMREVVKSADAWTRLAQRPGAYSVPAE